MTNLELTDGRVALLRGVAAGQVLHVRTLNTSKPEYDLWLWIPGASRRVTNDIAKLRDAGLIELGQGEAGRLERLWQISAAGEQWLARHEQGSGQ